MRRLVGRRALRTSRSASLAAQQCVLLHCQEGSAAEVALMLAGGLHWYGGLQLEEAAAAVELALGQQVGGGAPVVGRLMERRQVPCSRARAPAVLHVLCCGGGGGAAAAVPWLWRCIMLRAHMCTWEHVLVLW